MNKYQEMKRKHQEIYNGLPLGFAFSKQQFSEMMEKWNLKAGEDNDKITSIGGGGYLQKKDIPQYRETVQKIKENEKSFLENPDNLRDAFLYELRNHEYVVTYDVTDALDYLGFDGLEALTPKQMEILRGAAHQVIEEYENYLSKQ